MKRKLPKLSIMFSAAMLLQIGVKAQVVTTLTTADKYPASIIVGTNDTLIVASSYSFKIVKIAPTGAITPFVGNGSSAPIDGIGAAAGIGGVNGMVKDGSGNIFAADFENNSIRKITPGGIVSTFITGIVEPVSIVWGKNDTLIVNSWTPGIIYKVAPSGIKSVFATVTTHSLGLAKGKNDTLYLAGYVEGKISKIDPNGTVTTLAGSGSFSSGDGTGAGASFKGPINIVVDPTGTLYVLEYSGSLVRRVTAEGVVTTFAGNGTVASVDGTGTAASFDEPLSMALSTTSGNFFIGDGSGKIRKMSGGGTFIKTNNVATNTLKIYPTVFAEGFSIISSIAQKVRVVNTLGQVVTTFQIMAGEQYLSLSTQAAGTYFVQCENGVSYPVIKK